MKMNKQYLNGITLCLTSGILTSIAYLNKYLSVFVFFSLIPLFVAFFYKQNELTIKHTLTYIFIYSMSFYIITLHWIYKLTSFINFEKIKSFFVLTLSIFLIAIIMSCFWCISFIFYHRLKKGNFIDIFIFSFLYILGEWLQGLFYPLAFPWARLANIITPFTIFIQSASLFGSLFISLLILIINGFLAIAVLNIKDISKYIKYITIAISIFIINITFGLVHFKEIDNSDKNFNVLLIQSNLAKINKWSITNEETYNLFFKTTSNFVDTDTDLVIFPETALHFNILENNKIKEEIFNFTEKYNVTILTGFIHYENDNKYNSMVAFMPDGTLSNIYSKQILVPIGEMIPFESVISKIIPNTFFGRSSFTEGEKSNTISTRIAELGGIICYESIFPDITRKSVNNGAQAITLISNDSWFGESSALFQHHSHAILRAVENNRYVLRCSNSAITSIISPFGKIEKIAPKYKLTGIDANISLNNITKTLYSKIGDIIVIPGIILFLYSVIIRIFIHKS